MQGRWRRSYHRRSCDPRAICVRLGDTPPVFEPDAGPTDLPLYPIAVPALMPLLIAVYSEWLAMSLYVSVPVF